VKRERGRGGEEERGKKYEKQFSLVLLILLVSPFSLVLLRL
jgi:hypothetical protein